ncbi:MAG: hypothetical protein AAB586_02310 [Patescibacteria group bacterium]
MNQPVTCLLSVIRNDIQVSGLQGYPESRWREAILSYLFGVWSNKPSVIYRPKISFGGITLRLDLTNWEYYAYGHAEIPQEAPPLGPDDLVETLGKQVAVEVALMRFVKDNRIKQLRLCLPSIPRDGATFILWKKERRGEYGYSGVGLPFSWGTKGPWWTREEFERWL